MKQPSLREIRERAATEAVRELLRQHGEVRRVALILAVHTNTVRWYMKKADISPDLLTEWQGEIARQKELFNGHKR